MKSGRPERPLRLLHLCFLSRGRGFRNSEPSGEMSGKCAGRQAMIGAIGDVMGVERKMLERDEYLKRLIAFLVSQYGLKSSS